MHSFIFKMKLHDSYNKTLLNKISLVLNRNLIIGARKNLLDQTFKITKDTILYQNKEVYKYRRTLFFAGCQYVFFTIFGIIVAVSKPQIEEEDKLWQGFNMKSQGFRYGLGATSFLIGKYPKAPELQSIIVKR